VEKWLFYWTVVILDWKLQIQNFILEAVAMHTQKACSIYDLPPVIHLVNINSNKNVI